MDTKRETAEKWQLDVYVLNTEPRSSAAIANLKRICNQHLPGRYRIQVLDLKQTPRLAREDRIFALPTIVRRFPLPERRLIGTLSNLECAMAALDIPAGL